MSRDTNAALEIPLSEGSKTGRIVGWLVSYGLDSNGAAFELRTGRTFLSSTTLLPAGQNGNVPEETQRCIIVKEDGVSSLHLALLATADHKLFIQDIFSEHGTFITKADADEETRLSGTVNAVHGDWIRVGEKIRFQVCLIDGRRK